MSTESKLTELAIQQLVRYEALFKLLDDIQGTEDISLMSTQAARQWKYFARVSSWRLVIIQERGFLIIDGERGEAKITEVSSLPPWDAYHYTLKRPCGSHMNMPPDHPSPPKHLSGNKIAEIRVFPFSHGDQWGALLSVATLHEPFSELDAKFNRIFGSHFTERISGILLRRQMTETLMQKALRDALTGLYNRGAIIEHLGSKLSLVKRTGRVLSLILADIDFFKQINDNYGHLAGDAVLREISSRLKAVLRESESLGRYGGEEFLFVLFPCDKEEAVNAAERFRQVISDTPVFLDGNAIQSINVSISLGTTSTECQPDVSIDTLIKQADDALYKSKSNGRNRVTTGGV